MKNFARRASVLTVLVLAAAVASAPFAGAEARVLKVEDSLSLKAVTDPQLSPDGKEVAFVVTTIEKDKRRSTVWVAATDGRTPPRALTSGPQSASAPRWSPDGRSIAFTSTRPDPDVKGADKAQVYLLTLDGGEARRVTTIAEGVRALAWSPDGTRLAVLGRVPPAKDDLPFERTDSRRYTGIFYKFDGQGWDDGKRTQVFTVDVATGDAKQVTSGDSNASDPTWSPDGTRIAYVADLESKGTDYDGRHADVYVVPATGGNAVKISDNPEADNNPTWSPDGKEIAFLGTLSEGGHTRLYIAPAAGGPARLATTKVDHLGGNLRWEEGGKGITYEANTKGEHHLFRVDLATKDVTQVTRGGRTLSQIDVNDKAGLIAYRAEDPAHPNDIYVADLQGNNERRLTRLNESFLAGLSLPDVERLAWKGAEGLDVEGYLMKPVGLDRSRKYPMILWVHGGPNGMHGRQWFFDASVLAGHGYAVFMANPRGSSGYGEKFQRAVENEWGGKAYQDLMMGVDAALKANPWIDGQHMGVVGISYGGFMTNWIVSQTTRFKAAVTMAGLVNMVSAQGTRDAAYNHRRDFGGTVFENYQKYWDYSPLKYVGQVKTPTLLLHGEADHRVPLSQAEEWFRALKVHGVPTELVIFPRGSHGFRTIGEPKQVVEALNWQVYWFDKYLKVGD